MVEVVVEMKRSEGDDEYLFYPTASPAAGPSCLPFPFDQQPSSLPSPSFPRRQKHQQRPASPPLGTASPSGHGEQRERDMLRPAVAARKGKGRKRQDPSASTTDQRAEAVEATPTGTVVTSTLISSSASASSSAGELASPVVTSIGPSTFTSTFSSSSNTSTSASADSQTQSSSTTFSSRTSLPWSTRTTSTRSAQSSTSTCVPGVILNLTLAGDSDTEAVYSVQMGMGHGSSGDSSKRGWDWDGESLQTLNLQVDLGSSDLWVASDTCTSSECKSTSQLFNASQSLDSGSSASLTFQSGSASGEIYWEEITLGNFTIGYQAMVVADTVTDEDLSGGNYSGVLGLALPANSVIYSEIGGTTGSSPDGATFLDNLFGMGQSAPTERLFSLALARLEDVRTTSFLGIGAIYSSYCPSPCQPPYSPIISQPNLGVTGYTHWRIQLESMSTTTWSDAQNGVGNTTTALSLGASLVDTSKGSPIAVLDSGGMQILVGSKTYADTIYGAYGISASSDGLYRMPCTTPLSFSFNFAGINYPVHPLDMSYTDPSDPSQQTCIGSIQVSSDLGTVGDFVLGSSFLKNVYSIYRYPDTNKSTTWQPTVGLVSLINASVASQDFYAVRTLHQSLASVSANHQTAVSPQTTSPSTSSSGSDGSSHVANKAVIVAVSVVGFFVVAAGLFCAWYFWLRRKLGASGVVVYKTAPTRPRHDREASTSSLRTKKHDAAMRQKSMIEGYSDFEGDSWMSTTEGGDSIRLGYLPEAVAVAEHSPERAGRKRGSAGSSVRENSWASGSGAAGNGDPRTASLIDVSDEATPEAEARPSNPRRTSATRSVSFSEQPLLPTPATTSVQAGPPQPLVSPPPPIPTAYPYPASSQYPQSGPYPPMPTSRTSKPGSMSMSGPFPSPAQRPGSSFRPDSSPMYDIRSSDYFDVGVDPVGGGVGRDRRTRGRSMGGDRSTSRDRERERERRTSPSKQGVLEDVVTEEPETGPL